MGFGTKVLTYNIRRWMARTKDESGMPAPYLSRQKERRGVVRDVDTLDATDVPIFCLSRREGRHCQLMLNVECTIVL